MRCADASERFVTESNGEFPTRHWHGFFQVPSERPLPRHPKIEMKREGSLLHVRSMSPMIPELTEPLGNPIEWTFYEDNLVNVVDSIWMAGGALERNISEITFAICW